MKKTEIAKYKIEDLHEGQRFSFRKFIGIHDVDNFAELSGDCNPLHMNEDFSHSRGFKGRVVHGALLIAYFSQLIGVYFPGENCLFHSVKVNFVSPAYINDTVEITAVIDQISINSNVMILNLRIENAENKAVLLEGKAQIGFTKIKG